MRSSPWISSASECCTQITKFTCAAPPCVQFECSKWFESNDIGKSCPNWLIAYGLNFRFVFLSHSLFLSLSLIYLQLRFRRPTVVSRARCEHFQLAWHVSKRINLAMQGVGTCPFNDFTPTVKAHHSMTLHHHTKSISDVRITIIHFVVYAIPRTPTLHTHTCTYSTFALKLPFECQSHASNVLSASATSVIATLQF